MAILKHIPSKNANYTDVLTYYTYKHYEDLETNHYTPIMDEYGLLQPRENCSTIYLTAQRNLAEPEQWAEDCQRINLAYGKNTQISDVKNHTYIISHPAGDRSRMTMEDLLAEGRAFVTTNLEGYGALISVHRDTDNDHIHITINSVRELEREPQPWMQRNEDGEIKRCEYAAGGKHQNNGAFLVHAKDWLLEYTRQHGLEIEDNNAKAAQNKQERQKDGLTVHQRELKEALLKTVPQCQSFQEVKDRLLADYGILLKPSATGKTVSLQHPDNDKAVRLRTLGLDMDIFAFTDTPQPPQETAVHPFDNKSYSEWLSHRHVKNAEKAGELLHRGRVILSGAPSTTGKHRPSPQTQERKTEQLIKRMEYAEKDLREEAAKLDVYLSRWRQYFNSELDAQERERQGSYLQWSGVDPNDRDALAQWEASRRDIEAAIKALSDARSDLREHILGLPREEYRQQKSYSQWLRELRNSNAEKAEKTIAAAEARIAAQLREKGEYYRPNEFRELNDLIRQAAYVERDLSTEAAKVEKVLEHWHQYLDPELDEKQRKRHGCFLQEWGVDLEDPLALSAMEAMADALEAQYQHIQSVREVLTETAEQWKGFNEAPAAKLSYALDRERELKAQLQTIQANRKKLGDIAVNCHASAARRIYKDEQLKKADYFYQQWQKKLEEERCLQSQLRQIRQQQRQAKRELRTAPEPEIDP